MTITKNFLIIIIEIVVIELEVIDVSDCRVFNERSRFFDIVIKASEAIVIDGEDTIDVDVIA